MGPSGLCEDFGMPSGSRLAVDPGIASDAWANAGKQASCREKGSVQTEVAAGEEI